MTAASISSISFNGDGTETLFMTNLVTAMSTAGFTLVDSYAVSSQEYRLWSYTASAATYGTLYIQVSFNTLTTFKIAGGATYTSSSKTLNNASSPSTKSITLTQSFILTSINHPEVRGVLIFANGSSTPLMFAGYLRPLNVPTWWSESSYPYAFFDSTTSTYDTQGLVTISSLAPGSISTANGATKLLEGANTTFNTVNSSKRTLLSCYILNSGFVVGSFSSDVLVGGSNAMNCLDIFQVTVGSEEYTLVESSSATLSKLVIRST